MEGEISMGDGGVACMPLQYIMERLPSAEKTVCRGKSGNGFNSKLLKFAGKERRKMKPRKSELGLDRVSKRNSSSNDVENGGEVEKKQQHEKVQKEEVEEGELGTLKWPRADLENGEFVPEMPPPPKRGEVENGEIVSEKWKGRELEKGEIGSGKWRKEDVEGLNLEREKKEDRHVQFLAREI